MNQPRKTAVESVDQIRAAMSGGLGQPIYPIQGTTPPPLTAPPVMPMGTPPGTLQENVSSMQNAWPAASFPPSPAPVQAVPLPVNKAPQPAAGPGQGEADCTPFRPVNRPSMALLTICDDGRKEGETLRLRVASTMIGRAQGDVLIPHDDAISGRHAEIVRLLENGRYRWYVRDLGSRNGTFVRAAKAILRNNQEILIGSHRYRFQPATIPQNSPSQPNLQETQTTRGWQAVSAGDIENMFPALVEETPVGPGGKFALSVDEMWIGSDPQQCSLVIPDDPFVSPRHAKIVNKGGQWMILNAHSTNGLWMRIESIPVEQECEFQLGEQRFFLRIA